MFLKLLLLEFCSPMPALSPAEIEEELKVLQDVPSLLRQYVEAETAGKKNWKWGTRAEDGVRMIWVGSPIPCIFCSWCVPDMRDRDRSLLCPKYGLI